MFDKASGFCSDYTEISIVILFCTQNEVDSVSRGGEFLFVSALGWGIEQQNNDKSPGYARGTMVTVRIEPCIVEGSTV